MKKIYVRLAESYEEIKHLTRRCNALESKLKEYNGFAVRERTMAKKKIGKLTGEYRKARASLLRKIKRYEQAGYDTKGAVFTAPPIPEKITRGTIKKVREQSAEITKLRRQGKIPINGDLYLIKVFEGVIYSALQYTDPYGKKENTMRVRHRAWESSVGADEAEIAHNLAVRIVANRNLGRTWPLLVTRLERFIYDSDQYGYDGDLLELQSIFAELIDEKGDGWSAEDEERMAKEYDAMITVPWEILKKSKFDWEKISEDLSYAY